MQALACGSAKPGLHSDICIHFTGSVPKTTEKQELQGPKEGSKQLSMRSDSAHPQKTNREYKTKVVCKKQSRHATCSLCQFVPWRLMDCSDRETFMWELSREYFFLLVTRAHSYRKLILLQPVWSDNALKSLKNGLLFLINCNATATFRNLSQQEVPTNNRWQPKERTNLFLKFFFSHSRVIHVSYEPVFDYIQTFLRNPCPVILAKVFTLHWI